MNAEKVGFVPDIVSQWSGPTAKGATDADADVFATKAWFGNLVANGFAQAVQPLVLEACDPQTAVAFLIPLQIVGIGNARGLSSLSNYYSSLYGPIGDCADASQTLWRSAGQQLRRHASGAVVLLQPMASEAAFYQRMARGLAAAGYWLDSYFCFGNWYLPVAGRRYQDYFASLPSTLRHSVERGRRRLVKEPGWRLDIHSADDAQLDAVIADFESVYNQSWKEPEPCLQFMPGLIRMAAAEGWLRLGILRLGGQPIAAQVWLVKDGKANIYKLAYVTGFERFSPGSVLTAALMQHAIDADRVHEVDYLTGDDAYKRDWMSHRRERVGLVAFDPLTLRGLAGAVRHFGGRWLRALNSRLRPPAGA